MPKFKEVIKKNFKIITTIEIETTCLDGFPECDYELQFDRAIPLLDSIIMMTGVLFIESDPEGLKTITYTDGKKENFRSAKKHLKEFDNFFSLVSYLQDFRNNN